MPFHRNLIISHGSIVFLLFVSGFVLQSSPAFALQPGDMVFADSGGVWTGLGYSNMKKQFGVGVGHAGIYVGKKDGVPMVVHCYSPCGVVEESMTEFPGYGEYRGARTSYPAPTGEQRRQIVDFARKQIGKEYTRLPWAVKGPTVFNCSGFTEAAYEHAGLDPIPWWCGDLPHRYVWPLEQYISPTMQDAHLLSGPIVSGARGIFMRLFMTFGLGASWLCFSIIVVIALRRRRLRIRDRKRREVTVGGVERTGPARRALQVEQPDPGR